MSTLRVESTIGKYTDMLPGQFFIIEGQQKHHELLGHVINQRQCELFPQFSASERERGGSVQTQTSSCSPSLIGKSAGSQLESEWV